MVVPLGDKQVTVELCCDGFDIEFERPYEAEDTAVDTLSVLVEIVNGRTRSVVSVSDEAAKALLVALTFELYGYEEHRMESVEFVEGSANAKP